MGLRKAEMPGEFEVTLNANNGLVAVSRMEYVYGQRITNPVRDQESGQSDVRIDGLCPLSQGGEINDGSVKVLGDIDLAGVKVSHGQKVKVKGVMLLRPRNNFELTGKIIASSLDRPRPGQALAQRQSAECSEAS